MIAPHLEAFNQIFEGGLDAAIAHLDAKDVVDEHGNRLICLIFFFLFFFPISN